jgi:peptidoglycan hydrolase-like amidase
MKIFYILFLFFSFFLTAFWNEELKIISRSEWWADENYRYIDSPQWQDILKKREEDNQKYEQSEHSEAELLAQKAKEQKEKEKNNILLNEFWKYIEVDSVIKDENWNKLAWPITKVKKINAIVIHHTDTEYSNSIDGINSIYKYHALTRQWWDIWYNFLIWKEWEIYEWRAWWDFVVAAHNKRNNMWSVWIAIIWDYSVDPINEKQYEWLKNLTKYLVEKYDIDLTEKTYFHEDCLWNECIRPLTSKLMYPITWHRDAWHTSCPWDALYLQIDQLRRELLKEPIVTKKLYEKRIFAKLEEFKDEQLISILANIESSLDTTFNSQKSKVKDLLISYFKNKEEKKSDTKINVENDEEQKIKIKLSYPNKDKITIKSWRASFELTRVGNDIYVKWQKYNILTIPKRYPDTILQITSWDRKPSWDTSWKYNDNMFRWDLTVYAKNNEIVVVNTLNIEDYLKWLWEVSDFEETEKIKTIIIAARSYATWYTSKERKFSWEFYDWIDDPNVFQKYLWYWLEQRSPNINKLVDETKWQLITYNWNLIKPWYFSSSNWKTMSFYEYCKIRYSDEICTQESKKYPYLQSVVDKWSDWLTKAWHWVWISWKWVSYFAEKWWNYDMIIKYFLKWVEVL